MPLSEQTKQAISAYLYKEISRYISESKLTKPLALDAKPFHARLLPALFKFHLSERSFSTRSGSWFQETARLVAAQFHKNAQLGFTLKGEIQPAASSHITTLLEQMNKGVPKRIANRSQDIASVLAVQSAHGAAITVTADLFVLTHDGTELYFEMKTPLPNKDTCMAMKRFILQVAAVRKGNPAQAFAATAYNPVSENAAYVWNYARQFLEIGEDMLIGRAFWMKIGDNTTYEELLRISEGVGERIAEDLVP